MKDVYPAISMSREFGELVTDITIDYPRLTDYMRQRGFADEEILATTVEISNETISNEYKNEPGKVYTTYGRYQHKDGVSTIALFPLETLQEAQQRKRDGEGYMGKHPEQGVSEYFSETLVHELEHHAIRSIEGGMRRKFLAYAIGRFSIKAATVGINALAVAGTAYRTIEQLLPAVPIDSPQVQVGVVAAAFATGIKAADQTITGYDFYYFSPEEVRCREAESYAPDNLVQFRIKDS